jgi:catalase
MISEKGTADTIRSHRGFAIKFYTEDGDWDLVGSSSPMFYLRDPTLFSKFIHSQKRGVDGLISTVSQWDFLTNTPETIFATLFVYSDRGIPKNFRHLDGFGCNTFILNKGKKKTAVKFHFKSCQGIKNLSTTDANVLAGYDSDSSIRDLQNNINNKNFPKWKFCVQLVTYSQKIKKLDQRIRFIEDIDPEIILDPTKIWSTVEVPEIEIGTVILDDNRHILNTNLLFNPANFINGIGPSEDKVLQMRISIYKEIQKNRTKFDCKNLSIEHTINKCLLSMKSVNCDDYSQATQYYLTLNHNERKHLAKNLAEDLQKMSKGNINIIEKALHIFNNVHFNLKDSVKAYFKNEDSPIYSKILKNNGYEFLNSSGF